MPTLALNLVEEAITQILAHGGYYDQGRAFVLYTKCLVATAPTCDKTRKGVILKAIKALSKAKNYFTKVEAYGRLRITLCLESLLCHEIDLKTERNQCAFEFRQLDQQLLTKLNNLFLYWKPKCRKRR